MMSGAVLANPKGNLLEIQVAASMRTHSRAYARAAAGYTRARPPVAGPWPS